jgi:hypothetical protein
MRMFLIAYVYCWGRGVLSFELWSLELERAVAVLDGGDEIP